ncbi:hypothetical protein LINGRAHAP2_LOCUS7739, partial [Linum grandiflorum]
RGRWQNLLSRVSFMMTSSKRMEKYYAITGCEHLDEFHAQRRTREGSFVDAHDIRQRSKRDVGTSCGSRSMWMRCRKKKELTHMVDNLKLQVQHLMEENEWL